MVFIIKTSTFDLKAFLVCSLFLKTPTTNLAFFQQSEKYMQAKMTDFTVFQKCLKLKRVFLGTVIVKFVFEGNTSHPYECQPWFLH